MKFRLTYAGPLLSSKPPYDKDQRDKRIEHKHRLRRHFHKQLKEYWSHHRFLSEWGGWPSAMGDILPEGAQAIWGAHGRAENERRSLPEILGPVFGHSGYKFVPLVWKENSVSCSLRILCLRRDHQDAILPARDLDNRIKTLIDALTMPLPQQGTPLENGKPLPPQEGEDPFFVLLDDDRQITHLEVEADTALEACSPYAEDESFVRLIIHVEIRPTLVTTFNLSFA